VELAGRLAGTVRGTDSVARVGHDELAVLVHGRSPREIEAVAARILDRVGAPVAGLGGSVVIPASLGMAMTSPGDDADIVMLNAERCRPHRTRVVATASSSLPAVVHPTTSDDVSIVRD